MAEDDDTSSFLTLPFDWYVLVRSANLQLCSALLLKSIAGEMGRLGFHRGEPAAKTEAHRAWNRIRCLRT